MEKDQGEVNGKELARLLMEQKRIRAHIELEKAAYKAWLREQQRHKDHKRKMEELGVQMIQLGVAVDAGAARLWQGDLGLT